MPILTESAACVGTIVKSAAAAAAPISKQNRFMSSFSPTKIDR
jgi:hypothetical protein